MAAFHPLFLGKLPFLILLVFLQDLHAHFRVSMGTGSGKYAAVKNWEVHNTAVTYLHKRALQGRRRQLDGL